MPEPTVFLALLVGVFFVSFWMRSRSGPFPSQEKLNSQPAKPHPFVAEVEGSLASPGIYTFPKPVGTEQLLLRAGIPPELIPRDPLPGRLKNGTALILSRSGRELRIRVEPMDPAKKILYTLPSNLNDIQPEDLTLIPGIGPSLAKRIVRYRDQKGGFTHLDDLLTLSGVGRKKLDSLRPYLEVERTPRPIP